MKTTATLTLAPSPAQAPRKGTKAALQAELTEARERVAELEQAAARDAAPWLRRVTAFSLPVISGSLGWGATELLGHQIWWGFLPLLMAGAVLWVSMPHVATGLERVLHIPRHDAWKLAVAVDASILVAEAMVHFVSAHPVWWVVMGLGLIGSAVFNVKGFEPA